MEGDTKTMTVRYCLPRERFETARERIRLERSDDIARVRNRFAGLERGIARGELGWAEGEIAALAVEIGSRALETERYESPLTGDALSLREWLVVWRKDVRRGGDLAEYLTAQARDRVDGRRLAQAEQLLVEAERADPMNVRVLTLRGEVQELKKTRERHLTRSRSLARKGRFSAAEAEIRAAEVLDLDDGVSIDLAESELSRSRSVYLSRNPRFTAGLSIGVGALGADPDATAADLSMYQGTSVSADPPVSFGVDGTLRVGRFLVVALGGSYGWSLLENAEGGEIPGLEYTYTMISASAGVRSSRREDRRWSLAVLGGVARESVDVSVEIPGVSSSESRTAGFARVQAEFSVVTIYAQAGLGFDAEAAAADSIVHWSDQFQVGLRFFVGR